MKNKILALATTVAVFVCAIVAVKFVRATSINNILPVEDSDSQSFIPSNSSILPGDHHKMVNENECDGDQNFNYTNSVGNAESYGLDLSSVPNNAFITSITITPCASGNAAIPPTTSPAGARMDVFYRLNHVVNSSVGTYFFDDTNKIPAPLPPTQFSGLSILKAAGTHLQVGAQYISGTAGVRLSQIVTDISYVQVPIFSTSSPATVSSIKKFSATLNAQANPNTKATTGWFRYSNISPGTCNDVFGTKVPSLGIALGSGNLPVPYSTNVTGLFSGTRYYYCAIASNADGVSFSALQSFVTLPSF